MELSKFKEHDHQFINDFLSDGIAIILINHCKQSAIEHAGLLHLLFEQNKIREILCFGQNPVVCF